MQTLEQSVFGELDSCYMFSFHSKCNQMPPNQSLRIGRRYAHFMFRLGILLGSLLITAWMPGGQAQPANTHSKETFTYKKVGDLEIKADVYRPAGVGPHPAIVWIHGGGLIFGSRATIPADENDLFLRAGYIVVSIDYRLAPETKLPAILEDVEDAYRWVREKGPGLFQCDPERLAVVGQSGGAYLALMSGARLHPSPKVVVSFYGYGDIAGPWLSQPTVYWASDPSQPRVTKEAALQAISRNEISEADVEPRVNFYIYCRQNGLWPKQVAGFDPLKEREKLIAYSPDRLVKPGYPPTLLLHGDRDTDVPFQLSEQMAAALQQQHIEHSLYRVRGFNHLFDVFPDGLPPAGKPIGLQNPQAAAAFQAALLFIAKHIGTEVPN
jgi:acetyl esterase/lipase